jgi:PBP1b-binding outer membrane lipoprotein LpoB
MKKIILLLTIAILALSSCSVLSSKASKEDVKKGIVEIIKDENTGLSDSQIEKIADCTIDKVYDDLSKTSANNLADGKDKNTSEDATRLETATLSCVKSYIEQ